MTKKLMRSLVPVMALSLAVGLFTGCSGGGEEETTAAAAGTEAAGGDATEAADSGDSGSTSGSAKDTLIIATANETPSVTTNLHNAVAGDYLNKMTHNGLFKTDENMEVVPDLVESYENTSDTEWIFHLKQGVLFHNGEEMKAEDVKASLELCKESPEVSQYGTSTGTIEVVDDYTIKITTDGPQAGLLSDLTHHGNYILPADLIESGHDFNSEPIGTGPYKLVAWNKGERLEFEAFEDYFGGAAPIKHITWRVIPEGSSRTMALEAGEVDLIIEVETTDATRIAETDGLTLYSEAGTSHNFMMINNEVAPFNNIDFRKALASAIDKNAIVQVALNGDGSATDCLLPECFEGTTNEGAVTYDPEQAKAYLEASGLDPAQCGFSLICSDDTKLRAGQVIQSSLKENLGIDIQLESMDLATYLDVTASGDYQAAIGGYTSSNVLAYSLGVFHSSSINASNKTRTNDPAIDAAIEKVQATLDPEENVAAITELNKLVNENCPQVPLYLKNNTRAYKSDLQGFNVNAGGTTYYEQFSWGN